MENKQLLTRGVAKVLPSVDNLSKLLASKKIRIYMGIDPTGRLHIGHAIGLRKLMEFANAGHEAIFLFGTGTVQVGDPSLRDSARQEVSQVDIDKNIKDWQATAKKIIDFSKVKIMQNGDWINKMSLKDLIAVASKVSAVQLFKRESFQRRLEQGDTVWYHETMYPLLQGYDSVKLDVDLEIGGSDQEFNMLMGRELQKKINHKEKYVITTPMILGTDGKQMSKTSGNCVWLDDSPAEMYGKLMSVPDEQTNSYLELCTGLTDAELSEIKKSKLPPRELKAKMAVEVTKLYHGEDAAQDARDGFDAQFKEGKAPADITKVELETRQWEVADLLVAAKLADSKSAARRLIEQGGVKINSQAVSKDGTWKLKSGDVIQVGKRHFAQAA